MTLSVTKTLALELAIAAAIACPSSLAQAPSQSAQSHAQANPLPLSGRSTGNASVTAIEAPIAGTTNSVTTINPSVQVHGTYAGSSSSASDRPFSGKLSLRDAIARGLSYNLGAANQNHSVRQAGGQSQIARSALLPNISGYIAENLQQTNLAAQGLRINTPGFAFPTIVGPYNNIDLRGSVSQSILDLTAWNNFRSSKELYRSAQLSARDAHEQVVLAVCGTYLQIVATSERIAAARAQFDTANALFQQTQQKRGVGLVAEIDVDRSEVEQLTQQQRVISLEVELSKEKIALARITGLPPTDAYDLADPVPFADAPALTLNDAIHQALDRRADIQAADAQVHAAERTLAAAHAERIPSLSVSGNYGAIGTNPAQAKATFSAAATLSIPIWQGGRTEGDIKVAQASLAQRHGELEDIKGQVEADVRNAYLELQAAASQVKLAQRNLQVSQETLGLTRQRFDAGVTDSVELVQAQESLTSAQLDRINSVFAHNIAKLSLARATASAADDLQKFLNLQ
ncbi:MAG: TolC family protein [Acidobacteriota bacterium]|nr:TolC family protein [Acidobacteriota bacterium]